MKTHVVCLKSDWKGTKGNIIPYPIKGEIYQVDEFLENPENTGDDYYVLNGFDGAWNTKGFRPTDDTFGVVITENLEKQKEYEHILQ